MIKEILSMVNLTHILNFINPFLTKQHFEYIKASINKFLLCRDIKAGFIKYSCTECGHYHTIPITCKSRLCPSCGFKYSATWTQKMINDILNIPHRHILFTIPEELRPFFRYDRTLLSKLAKAVNEVLKYIFKKSSNSEIFVKVFCDANFLIILEIFLTNTIFIFILDTLLLFFLVLQNYTFLINKNNIYFISFVFLAFHIY